MKWTNSSALKRFGCTTVAVGVLLLLAVPAYAQRQIAVGDRTLGSIPSEGGMVEYELVVEESLPLLIRMERILDSTIDPKVSIQNADGEQVGVDDDGGEGLNSRLSIRVRPGRYTIYATAVGNTMGDYILLVEREEIDDRGSIDFGQARTGTLETGDRHHYSVTIQEEMEVAIRAEHSEESELDPKVSVYDADGALIGTDDDGGEGRNAYLITTLSPGTYDIVVFAYGSTEGDYRLMVDRREPQELGSIAVGQTRPGELLAPRDCHEYDLQLDQQVYVYIDLVKADDSGLDPKLYLMDSDGVEIENNDDGGEGTNSLIRRLLPAGTYTISVRAYGSTRGAYELSVSTGSVVDHTITLGDRVIGQFGQRLERHSYRFTLDSETIVIAEAQSVFGAPGNPVLAITDESGSDVQDVSNEMEYSSSTSEIRRRLSAGSHRLIVGNSEAATGFYVLSFQEGIGPNSQGVSEIVMGQPIQETVEPGTDGDYYRFSATEPLDVIIRMDSREGSTIDPRITLRNAEGVDIQTDDDGGESTNSLLRAHLTPGIYMILASGVGNRGGNYELAIDRDIVEAEDIGLLTSTYYDTASISETGQRKIYTFSLDTAANVVIDMNRPGDEGIDCYLELHSETGGLITQNDDYAEALDSRIEHLCEPGAFRVIAKGFSNSTGDFTFRVTLGSADVPDSPDDQPRNDQMRGEIRYYETQPGTVGGSDTGRDVWTFTTQVRSPVSIRLNAAPGSDLDPFLTLLNQAGEEIQHDDDGGEGRNSLIETTLDQGSYRIAVSGYGSSEGDYQLRVTLFGDLRVLDFRSSDYGLPAISDSRMECGRSDAGFALHAVSQDVQLAVDSAGVFDDAVVGLHMTQISGAESGGAGVAFRIQDGETPDMYVAEINRRGQYRVRERINGSWNTLTGWTQAGSIHTGRFATNVIHVRATGEDFELLINGARVESVHDDSLSEGLVGLYAERGQMVLVQSLEMGE